MHQMPHAGVAPPRQQPVPLENPEWFVPITPGDGYCLRCSKEALSALVVIGVRYPLCGDCIEELENAAFTLLGDDLRSMGTEDEEEPVSLIDAALRVGE